MPYLTNRDATRLYYEEAGEGKPLLFVHGWSFSSQIWLPQIEYFSSRYRCIVFDLRGHGRSQPSGSEYGIDVLAADVTWLFDRLGLFDVTLLGWSLGALVALAAYPSVRERLASLVLVSGTSKYCSSADYSCGLPPHEPKSLSLLVKRNPQRAMEGFLRRMFCAEEGSERGLEDFERDMLPLVPSPSPEGLLQTLQTLVTTDLRPVLSSVQDPALLIHGDRDLICPVDASRFMAERIFGAHCTILAGAGHAPMFSRPDEFNSAIETFLTTIYG